jgi:hypothetical protein
MALGHRMTVVRLPDTTLWVHSPVAYSEALLDELGQIGVLTHIVAPNCVHDTYLSGWIAACPKVRFHAAQGFSQYRPDLKFTSFIADTPLPEWDGVLAQHLVRGAPRINEIAFLHRASRTLILTDLCFNLGPEMPLLSRVLVTFNDCYCKFGPSRLLRATIKDREAFRTSVSHILRWDFDRIILSHGEIVEHGGRELLRQAYAFL